MKKVQIEQLEEQKKAHGGELFRTRKGRSVPRPLDTRNTMHLVLRSTKAKGEWSFKRPQNEVKIKEIVDRFSSKYEIEILSLVNVGTHLHFHMKLKNRLSYAPFIRGLSSALAMAITGNSRWNSHTRSPKEKFWDYRPFTRVVKSASGALTLKDYLKISDLEGVTTSKPQARNIITATNKRK